MKLELLVESGFHAGRRYALEEGRLELGRAEGCDVAFDAQEVEISRQHASVSREDAGYKLVDHSANGTFVNGQRIRVALLDSGDVIRLGVSGPTLRATISGSGRASEPAAGASRRRSLAEHGLYDPLSDKGRSGWLGILVVLVMTGSGVCLGLLTALMLLFQLGFGAALVGVTVAFAAAPFYLLIWLWLDRYDPEPAWMLAAALLWGAGAATFVAGTINSFFSAIVFSVTQDKNAAHFLSASLSAPLAEEALKGLAVLVLFLAIREEFDGVLDGIVYSGVVALGFAAVENVLYYGSTVRQGLGALAALFFLRGVLGPFAHALFTSMTGIGCGIARQSHNKAVRFIMPLVGYGGAVTLHFLWNVLASIAGTFAGAVVVYVIVWAPLFLVFFSIVIWMGFRERRLIRDMLELEVARGLLSAEQADIVASWTRRMRFLMAAFGDSSRFSARRRFSHAATRLALSHWHARRATAAGGETLSFSQIPLFQGEVARLRGAI